MLRCQCPSVCPSVCDGSALWSRCMPGRGEGSSRAMLATARLSCSICSSDHRHSLHNIPSLCANSRNRELVSRVHSGLNDAFQLNHKLLPEGVRRLS